MPVAEPPFRVLRQAPYPKDDPLLAWALRSEAFARYVDGHPVVFLRCPNKRVTPGIGEVLAGLATRISPASQRLAPVVVVDHSHEGPQLWPRYFEALHRFATDAGLPLSNVVYASQNRNGPGQQAAMAERAGRGESFRWLCFDHHLHRLLDFHASAPPLETEAGGEKSHMFLCTNRRPRAHRLVLLAALAQPPCRERALVTYAWPGEDHELEAAAEEAARAFPSHSEAIRGTVERLKEQRHVLSEDQGQHYSRWLYDVPRRAAQASRMTIVAESHFTDGVTHRVTEKSLKPVVCQHPFVVLGEYRSLEFLEALGFDVDFDGIDRRYDAIRQPRERMDAVLDVIRNLAMDPASSRARQFSRGNLERVRRNREHLDSRLRQALYGAADESVRAWRGQALGWRVAGAT